MSSQFDRVRPRSALPATNPSPSRHDSEGKRALFSRTSEVTATGFGSVLFECSRCGGRTALGLGKALRAMLPSLHLGLRFGRGDALRYVGVLKRDYPTLMPCPACGRPSWVRVTLQF